MPDIGVFGGRLHVAVDLRLRVAAQNIEILRVEPVAKPAFLHKSDDFGASPRSAQIGISDWA